MRILDLSIIVSLALVVSCSQIYVHALIAKLLRAVQPMRKTMHHMADKFKWTEIMFALLSLIAEQSVVTWPNTLLFLANTIFKATAIKIVGTSVLACTKWFCSIVIRAWAIFVWWFSVNPKAVHTWDAYGHVKQNFLWDDNRYGPCCLSCFVINDVCHVLLKKNRH